MKQVSHHKKKMSARKFLITVLAGVVMMVLFSVGVHVTMDVYGLFLPVKGKELKVYHHERISKYLLMHRYVPRNYNALLVGTSLSDNLDPSRFSIGGKYRLYNGSMMGANISEVKILTEKAIAGGIRNIIFCISPYQFKDTGAKDVALDNKLYYGALGSKNLYETYAVALIRHMELLPGKFPADHIRANGMNNFTERFRASDVEERIMQVAAIHQGESFPIDSLALKDFKELIQEFRKHDVHFMIYFHPVPDVLYDGQQDEYKKFESLIRTIVNDDNSVVNFNDYHWQTFTSDYIHYIDNGHLSEKGGAIVMDSLMHRF